MGKPCSKYWPKTGLGSPVRLNALQVVKRLGGGRGFGEVPVGRVGFVVLGRDICGWLLGS
eukprot:2441500-Karenia_brevis.AAC.1